MNKVFGVFVLVLVLVSTLGAGYALAQAAPESPDTGPSQEQYGTSDGAAPPGPTTGSADPATDGPEGPPDPASASASASSNALASATADPDGADDPAPFAAPDPPSAREESGGNASKGTAPSTAPGAVPPDPESAATAGSGASANSSAPASASASASAGASPPTEAPRQEGQARAPAEGADPAEDEGAPTAAEGSVEDAPRVEAEPDEGPAPSTEPPLSKDPFDGFSYRGSGEYEAWRARSCGEDDCGLQDIPPKWECYSYKKTVWGDVTYACGVPRSPDNKHPRVHVYDEDGNLVYEGSSEYDWIGYWEEDCGEDDCGAPRVPKGWGCFENYQKSAPNRKTEKYIQCEHPLVGEQDITSIPSKHCTHTYDLKGNLLSRYGCTPPSGGMMGDGAGGDAHNADVGLETGDGGDTWGGSEDGDGGTLATLMQAFTAVGEDDEPPPSAPPSPQASDDSAGGADEKVRFGAAAASESDSPAVAEGGSGMAPAAGSVLGSAAQRFSSDARAVSEGEDERALGAGRGADGGSREAGFAEVGSPAVAALEDGRSSQAEEGKTEPLSPEHAGSALVAGDGAAQGGQGGKAEPGAAAAQEGEGGGARMEREDRLDNARAEGAPVDGDADRVASVARERVGGLPWILSVGAGAVLVGGLAVRRGLRPRS